MRAYLLIPIAGLLAACETAPKIEKPEVRVVERVEYVLRIPPQQLMTLPPPVPQIDVDAARQSDIAQWILWSEERTRLLENMLIELAVFFKIEKLKLDDEAKKKNDESLRQAAEAATLPSQSASNLAK